jgi:hypothetical protein
MNVAVRRGVPSDAAPIAEGEEGELLGMIALEGEYVDQLYADPDVTWPANRRPDRLAS